MPIRDWSAYYELTAAKPPSPLLVMALEYVSPREKALDLGAGALKEAAYLLGQGFQVTVVDSEPSLEERSIALKKRNKKSHRKGGFWN